MLEVIFIALLCKKTKANAEARGKSTGVAIAYTIVLWFIFEIIGIIIGAIILSITMPDTKIILYLCGICGAAFGALIAYVISICGEKIEDTSHITNSQFLDHGSNDIWSK